MSLNGNIGLLWKSHSPKAAPLASPISGHEAWAEHEGGEGTLRSFSWVAIYLRVRRGTPMVSYLNNPVIMSFYNQSESIKTVLSACLGWETQVDSKLILLIPGVVVPLLKKRSPQKMMACRFDEWYLWADKHLCIKIKTKHNNTSRQEAFSRHGTISH